MVRAVFLAVLALTIPAGIAWVQERPQSGTIKRIDPKRSTIVLTVGGEDREFLLDKDTRFLGPGMKALPAAQAEKALREGARVMFRAARKDGKDVLLALRLDEQARADTSKLVPLPELGQAKYQGFPGGLYPEGKNERPLAHEKAGLALAGQVQPLDPEGKPSKDGKIVLLSVGMSNTSQVFSAFKTQADADREKHPKVVVVNGAQGGMTAARVQDLDGPKGGKQFWETVDQRLAAAGVTRAQVQVVWIKQADAGPSSGFPAYAKTLHGELAKIVQILPRRFPQVKLTYLSGRTYGGYATTRLNPEPYAYESGFAVKWLVEQQLSGDAALNFDPARGKVQAPWLSWGPYLWANGERKNPDGLSYEPADFGKDGTHPSPQGQRKVAAHLLRFFKSDTTTRPWFLAR